MRKERKNAEAEFPASYPFHPRLTDIFYSRWTQLSGFQRTRGILRTFAIALRDAEKWDNSPLVGPNVFLAAPQQSGIAEAARELTTIATREPTEGRGNDWASVLEALPDIVRGAAGLPLQFQLTVTLGDGAEVRPEVVASINELLQSINSDLVLKK